MLKLFFEKKGQKNSKTFKAPKEPTISKKLDVLSTSEFEKTSTSQKFLFFSFGWMSF